MVAIRDDQAAAIEAWLAVARPVLNLVDVRIELSREPADGTAIAAVWQRENADHSILYIGALFWPESPEDRRRTLTHELVHCVLRRYHDAVYESWEFIPEAERKVVHKLAGGLEEVAVDRLAEVIAPFLPIPEIPD